MANVSEGRNSQWFGEWGKRRRLNKVGKPLPHLPGDYQILPFPDGVAPRVKGRDRAKAL